MKKILFTGFILFVTLCAWAQSVPKTLGFQGYLTNKTTNDPLNGTFDMRISLHDKSTGGEELWFDEFNGVAVDKGLFYVVLGEAKPFDLPFNDVYHVEVKVGTEVMDGRLALTSSAYDIGSTNASNITIGFLSGNRVGPGVVADSITTGLLTNEVLDADLQDLADGSLTGTKVSPDFGGQNVVTTGTVTANSFSGVGSALTLISAANINGTLAVGKGGTGATSLTGVVMGNGGAAFSTLQSSAGSQYLRRNSVNSAYEFGGLQVTSPEIADGAILNADINGSAAIADSKLATITTAGKVSGSSITSGQIGGSTSISTSGNIVTSGYIQAGPGAPSLYRKKLTPAVAITTAGGTVTVSHGLDISKIVSVSVLMHSTVTSQIYSPGIKIAGGNSEFYWTVNSTVVNLIFVNGNCANLISGTARILVEYEP